MYINGKETPHPSAYGCHLLPQEKAFTKRAENVMGVLLAENLKTLLSASIAFVWTNAVWAKPKPL